MFIDLHIHTRRYSKCSVLEPQALVKRALKLKLDGFVIMEHNVVWSEEEIEELKEKTGAHELKILRGQEIRAYRDNYLEGDILTIGFYKHLAEGIPASEIIKMVHSEGGIAIAAHPFRTGLGLGESICDLDLDGIEVLNSNNTYFEMNRAKTLAEKLGIVGVGGSDAHELARIGRYLTFFESQINDEQDLIREIKAKRCRAVSYTEMGDKK